MSRPWGVRNSNPKWLAAVCLAAGCGGGGTTSVESPFVGGYGGTWAASGYSGQAQLQFGRGGILVEGGFSSMTAIPTPQPITLTGSVSNTGQFSGKITPFGESGVAYSGSLSLHGQTLTGTLTPASGASGQTYTIDVQANAAVPGVSR